MKRMLTGSVLAAFLVVILPEAQAARPILEDSGPDVFAPAADASGDPDLFHSAASELRDTGKGIRFEAEWTGPWRGQELTLVYRNQGQNDWQSAQFEADRGDRWQVVLPSGTVVPGVLEYRIVSRELDGSTRDRFASSDAPARVRVARSGGNVEDERLADHRGRRHRVEAGFRHEDFGAPRTSLRDSTDSYNVAHAEFTYRLLKPALYQISAGVALLGDRMGVSSPKPVTHPPGAYYFYVKGYWEFGDIFGVEPQIILGAGQEGFAGGGGVTLRFGAIRKTHFDLGFTGISQVGWTITSAFEWTGIPYIRLGLRNDLTTMPAQDYSASSLGIIPSARVTVLLPGGVEVWGSAGYGMRIEYRQGWVSWSAGAAVEF
jgi:hypothetical protein